MGGPGEICLPLNIAFAPSTWVALSLLLLLVEGNLPPSPRSPAAAPLVQRSHKLSLVLVPRSPKEIRRSRERARAVEAEIFILTQPELASYSGNRFCKYDRGTRLATKRTCCDVTTTWLICNGRIEGCLSIYR